MKDIQEFLKKNRLDFFLLPNCNEFFVEYLPKNDKLVEFITKFSGSNASVVFTQGQNYFFTDGRYVLQAKNQLDSNLYQVINISDISLINWLLQNVKNGKKIALDSRITSVDFIDRCQDIASGLVFIEHDFLNKIKTKLIESNGIAIQNKSAFFCADKICGKNFTQKRDEVVEKLASDALFISSCENLNWLLNLRGDDIEFNPIFLAQAILFKNKKLVILNDHPHLNSLKSQNVELVTKEFFATYLKNYIKSANIKNFTIQIDPATTNQANFQILQNNNALIIKKNCPISYLKSIKNTTEIEGAKLSHHHDAIAILKFLYWLDLAKKNNNIAQINEISAQEKLFELRKQNIGFYASSFATISGYGANGAIIHYQAQTHTNKSFNEDSLYLFDSGAHYLHDDFMGTTDVTRTIASGQVSAQIIEDYTLVLKGHIALAKIKFPKGTSGSNLDAIARQYLWNFQKNYDHGTGHGVGSFSCVHEGPFGIGRGSNLPLCAGIILSNEPGFYLENKYGIRLENLMLVKEIDKNFLGFTVLTLVPFELDLIDFKMLTYPEKKWLNAYHHQIFHQLQANLSDIERNWYRQKYLF